MTSNSKLDVQKMQNKEKQKSSFLNDQEENADFYISPY